DDQPQREAVFGGQQFAALVGGEQAPLGAEVGEPQVGAVSVLGPHHHMGNVGGGRGEVQDGPGGDAAPLGTDHAELGDAVQVGDDGGVRQGRELVVVPAVLGAVGGRAEHPEFPAFGPELGDGPVV